jgi:MFS family permease
MVRILPHGSATFLMGCLPTFAQIGYWATGLLVTLRFIQGFAVGGEWGSAVLLVAECCIAPSGRKFSHNSDMDRGQT